MSEEENISHISGNASDDIKRMLARPGALFTRFPPNIRGPIFGQSIQDRLVTTEISVQKKEEEPKKLEGRIVLELTVEDDMVNGGGAVHGGCSAFLIDLCSSLALMVLNLTNSGEILPSVSQSLNIVYHSPANLGDRIRIVNTTMTLGARAHSARTEIWNVTHHRLVSSGVHIKMQPSHPKANL
ncbi:HotDog domain-containing protein [Collybia nuda]|uniref:HotDog domain-containing protein n=1 Tax=Collybia nuda TaxID=64659 RepID=A0A9P5XWR9_9AGAR|nr:HotDog domain-containing protein [Collybia nuda]